MHSRPTGLLTKNSTLVLISLNLSLLSLDLLSQPLFFSNQLKNSMVLEYLLTAQFLSVSLILPTTEFPALSMIPLTELLSLMDHVAPLESIAQVMHTLAGKTVLITSSQRCKHSHLLMDPQNSLSLPRTSSLKPATEPHLELWEIWKISISMSSKIKFKHGTVLCATQANLIPLTNLNNKP